MVYGECLGSEPTVACCTYRPAGPSGMLIWDTPGDDRYSWAAAGVVQRADVIVYCESPGNHARSYREVNPTAKIIHVATKADTRSARSADARETSAATGEGTAELWEELKEAEEEHRQALVLEGRQILAPKAAPRRRRCVLV